jgi:hypothetical protein
LPEEDKTKLLETTPHFTWLNPKTKKLETRDARTGELLAVQKSLDENILYAKERKAQVVKVDGKDILVEAGVSLDEIPITYGAGKKTQWAYSVIIAEAICQKLIEGKPITKICEEEGYPPYYMITRWRKENSSFDKMVNDAYKHRAEFHRDKVLEVADEDPTMYDDDGKPIVTDDGEVVMKPIAERKLQIDTHKWLAGTDNADRFGNKTKVEGEIGVKHTVFVVDTGIRRPDDPGYNKDQTRIVQEREAKRIENLGQPKGETNDGIKPVGTFGKIADIETASDGGHSLSPKPPVD